MRATSAAWVGLGVLAMRYFTNPNPMGRRFCSLFAIAQARNTSAIIAAVAPRGCRGPC